MPYSYICVSGWVTSRTDGQRHYVTAARLPALYGVATGECLLMTRERYDEKRRRGWAPSVPVLWPDSSGNYTLPGEVL